MVANRFTVEATDSRIWPMGAVLKNGGAHFAADLKGGECSLLLWHKGELAARIPFPQENRIGSIWYMDIKGPGLLKMEYSYEVDGAEVSDSFGTSFTGGEQFGDPSHVAVPRRSRIYDSRFDWEHDRKPELPYEDCVFYRIHPRGFTMHSSSKVKEKGTFAGIAKKLSYLKKLGITSVELVIPVEFEEGNERINYWGYGPSWLFAPKASYCYGKNPEKEFKQLVKEFHANGMELLMELYIPANTPVSLFLDCLRFWVSEYHVDGFRLSGEAPVTAAATDPVLKRTKLLANSWEGLSVSHQPYRENREERFLAEYNDGFLADMRRFLKGDEGQINGAIFRIKRNPDAYGVINYMANTNGFNLNDMVSYDQKHNEANGEDNRDGNDCNFSWNCGAEGKTRKQSVLKLRRRQLKNAAVMLFLSQGTPLLLAGDEFLHTKGGNNNSYCQDNEVSWINWNWLKTNQWFYDFVRFLIEFRRKHPVFRAPREYHMMDDKAIGFPDLSVHGVRAWHLELESCRRQLGLLYCGAYAMTEDKKADNDFYAAYNMHWEPQEFALPRIARTKRWHLAVDTSLEEENGFYEAGREPLLKDQDHFVVGARTIAVLIAKEVPAEIGKKTPAGNIRTKKENTRRSRTDTCLKQ